MVRLAAADDYSFRVSDVEFSMPKPSYTIDTLTVLAEKHPDIEFHLIIGGDNLASFPRWKNHDQILEHFGLIVYPRPNSEDSDLKTHPKVQFIDAPEIDISATLIRKLIKEGKSIKYLVPDEVAAQIKSKGFFQ